MARAYSRNGANRTTCRIFVGKQYGKRPLGKVHGIGGLLIFKWILKR
jgi:hypothetical protein